MSAFRQSTWRGQFAEIAPEPTLGTCSGIDCKYFHIRQGFGIMAYMLGRYPACLPSSLALLALVAGGSVPSHAQAARMGSGTSAAERTVLAGSFASEKLWGWA